MKHAFAWLMTLVFTTPQILHAEGNTLTQNQICPLATIRAMTKAFESNDIDGVMSSYESPATIVFEPGSPLSDKYQIEQMFKAMALVKPAFVYPGGHEVVVSGNLALHIAPWRMTGRSPDGQDIAQSGLSVSILRRQVDGSWKLVVDNPHGGRLLENKSQ